MELMGQKPEDAIVSLIFFETHSLAFIIIKSLRKKRLFDTGSINKLISIYLKN